MTLARTRIAWPADVALREETPADFDLLAALYADTRAAELAAVPWPSEAKAAFLLDQFRRQHAYYREAYRGAEFLVIERDGRPIGRLYLHRGRGETRIMDIALIAGERGQGLGTRLIRAVMAAAERDDAGVTLHVEPANPAQRLYARLGFVLVEDRGVYQFLGWRRPSSAT